MVKLNGLKRLAASHSTAVGKIVGVVGTVITGGIVKDDNDNMWDVPTTTIPVAGEISVTVTAKDEGDIVAPAGAINKIATPTLGWQSFVSTADATVGAAVETDSALRSRQELSVMQPSISTNGGLLRALANLSGVTRCKLYENDTDAADANGIPKKSICAVVEGGTVAGIVSIIGLKKAPGAATYGTTSGLYTDPITGIPYTINYFTLADSEIKINITLSALSGYTSDIAAKIKQSLADYINAKAIGGSVDYYDLLVPARLNNGAYSSTYKIVSMTTAKDSGAFGTSDILIDFNKAAHCDVANITIAVA